MLQPAAVGVVMPLHKTPNRADTDPINRYRYIVTTHLLHHIQHSGNRADLCFGTPQVGARKTPIHMGKRNLWRRGHIGSCAHRCKRYDLRKANAKPHSNFGVHRRWYGNGVFGLWRQCISLESGNVALSLNAAWGTLTLDRLSSHRLGWAAI